MHEARGERQTVLSESPKHRRCGENLIAAHTIVLQVHNVAAPQGDAHNPGGEEYQTRIRLNIEAWGTSEEEILAAFHTPGKSLLLKQDWLAYKIQRLIKSSLNSQLMMSHVPNR